MKIYFDTEFTGLHKDTTLISIGCVSEDGRLFYAESTDYNRDQVDDWITENVIANLFYSDKLGKNERSQCFDMWFNSREPGRAISAQEIQDVVNGKRFDAFFKGDSLQVSERLLDWLFQFDHAEMHSDTLAYDWVLFCDLLCGGAIHLPKNIYYIPVDLSTALYAEGVDPDVSREEFSEVNTKHEAKHNSLWDAIVIKGCFDKLERLRASNE